jgi:arylsulfatase A-like enzyme
MGHPDAEALLRGPGVALMALMSRVTQMAVGGNGPRVDSAYRRATGAVLAFLAVSLLVKLGELLLTHEHRVHLPSQPGLASRAVQVWLWFRFSWQELAGGAFLLVLLSAVAALAPSPARWVRTCVNAAALVLLPALSLAAVLGIAYYATYQMPFTRDDFGYLPWAGQLVATSRLFQIWQVRAGLVCLAVLYVALPWAAVRWPWRIPRAAAAGPIGILILISGASLAAGRPNLDEAVLTPHPTWWLFAGHRVSYRELPPTAVLAPIGSRQRKHTPSSRPRNIMLFILESTPAIAVYPYNPDAAAGRRLFAQFGTRITLFEHVFAVMPNSASTLMSAMMGLRPLPTVEAAERAAGATRTLPEILRARGFRTEMYLNSDSMMSMTPMISRGFDRTLDANQEWSSRNEYVRMFWGHDDEILAEEMKTFLSAQTPASPPFFMVAFSSNPHVPYEVERIPGLAVEVDPKRAHRRLVERDLDLLTDVYASMIAAGLAEHTAVLVFGDHGEAFNEHPGNLIHSKMLYDENVHVPFLLIYPGRFGLPERIGQLGSLDDVLPTVCDLLGIDAEPRDGMSLLFEAPERMVYSVTDYGPGQVALRDARYTYLRWRSGRELLFDRRADPGEQRDIAAAAPDVLARFRSRLDGKGATAK